MFKSLVYLGAVFACVNAQALPEDPITGDPSLFEGSGRKTTVIRPKYVTDKYIHPIPAPAIKHRDIPVAKALNISEPVFICPKPGYLLTGEDCILTETVPARLECPIGYHPLGQPGRPELCERRVAPTLICPRGHLINGVCRVPELSDPIFSCPHGCEHNSHDGTCWKLEHVEPLAKCPEGSTRINHQCVIVEYFAPTYICPPHSSQEGKKCRVEVLVTKKKGRKLAEGEEIIEGESYTGDFENDFAEDDDNFSDDIDLLSELPAHVFESEDYEGETTWLPATGVQEYDPELQGKYRSHETVSYKTKKPKYVEAEVIREYPVGIEVPVVAKPVKAKKPKTMRVKVAKAPEQIVKIDSIPAQKICEYGEKVGSTCVVQTVVEPVFECPVPLIHGRCARRITVPSVTRCPVGKLVCPPRISGTTCQCETVIEISPSPKCFSGLLDGADCVSTAHPKEYCPIGFFLDHLGDVCVRRDIEPALCLFSVTYACPDCDRHHHVLPTHHHYAPLPLPQNPSSLRIRKETKYKD